MNKIIIHCSDSPNGRDDTAEDIHRWHLERGWDGIGYHHVIQVGGVVRNGRPHYWTGSHVTGHNDGSIGVCMVGTDQFDGDQWRALEGLVLSLHAQYPGAEILGHCELDSKKTCPNFDVRAWWADVKKRSID